MRHHYAAVAAAGLLLTGCVGVPCANNPAMTCYAPAATGPVAAPAPSGQAYVGEDGLTYVDGYPVDTVDGEQVYVVFVPALGWGFYDRAGGFHRASPVVVARLERSHPGGRGLPPGGPRGAVASGGRPGPGGRPMAGAPPGGRPGFAPSFAPGFAQGAPAGRPLPGQAPGRPGGPMPLVRPVAGGPVRTVAAAPAARPAPPPPAHHCAPGQRVC